jgi:hypothetical protein
MFGLGYGEEPWCKPFCCAIGLSSTLSITMVITGAWYLSWSWEEVREGEVEAYQAQIDRWNSERPMFQALQVSVRTNRSVAVLSTNSDPETFHDEENAADLPMYKPLKHWQLGVPFGFMPWLNLSFDDATEEPLLGPAISHVEITLRDPNGKQSIVHVGDFQMARVATQPPHTLHEQSGECVRHGGTYIRGHCWNIERATHICFTVRRISDSDWELHNFNSNRLSGCAAYNGGRWDSIGYSKAPLRDLDGKWEQQVRLEVRSSEDPYLAALNLTQGTLDFGMTAEDEQIWGQLLLTIGCVLAVPPSIALCVYWHCSSNSKGKGKSRYRDFMDDDMEATEYGRRRYISRRPKTRGELAVDVEASAEAELDRRTMHGPARTEQTDAQL